MRRLSLVTIVAAAAIANVLPDANAKPSNYVIVSATNLYRRADANAPKLRATGLRLLRVVRRTGTWLEVELVTGRPSEIGGSAHQCNIGGGGTFHLRFFIRRRDTLPVLKRDVIKRFTGGARVRVLRATPVHTPIVRKLAAGAPLTREFPLNTTSLSYTSKGKSYRIKKATRARLSRELRVPVAKDEYVMIKRRGRRSLLVEVIADCMRFTGWVPRAAVDLDGPGLGGIVGGAFGGRRDPAVRWLTWGAPVLWPDGSPAGETDTTLRIKGTWTTRNNMRCIKTAPGDNIQPTLLCLHPRDVHNTYMDAIGPRMSGAQLLSRRIAGRSQIAPSNNTRRAMRRKRERQVDSQWTICVSPGGTVSQIRIDKSTGYTALDRRVYAAIRAWRFPRLPRRACSSIKLTHQR